MRLATSMHRVEKVDCAGETGQAFIARYKHCGCDVRKETHPFLRFNTMWLLSLGVLLAGLFGGGCSKEKQPADDADRPALESVQPPTQDEPASPAPSSTPEAASETTPDPTGDAESQDPLSQTDDSLSLQQSLDNQPAPVDGDTMMAELGYVSPSDKVRSTLADPPGAVRLSEQSSLWVDIKGKRVFADGYVAQREAYLEMFACPAETKEHESVVGVVAKSEEVHAALLAVGAKQGTPVRFDTEYIPATGQPIRVWVMWYDDAGQFQYSDARSWVRHVGTDKSLQLDWVFAGSSLWKDPIEGKVFYQANAGEMICVSNFSTALMDLPVESSDANNELQFEAFTSRIPPPGTPVRLMLVPIESAETAEPDAGADDETADAIAPADQPPQADLLPLRESAAATPPAGAR